MHTDKYRGLKAISYSRASIGKNAGRQLDSTDRQKDEALLYAEKLGLDLDLEYRIVDEGVSAFKLTTKVDEYGRTKKIAKNLQEGALADFVEVVKKGRFPNGINLIVEKLDRLYRDEPRRALTHFLDLLDNGVTIHTLIDKKIYEPDSSQVQLDLMMSIMYLGASHQYSKDLSARIKLSYKRRIEKMMNNEGLIINTGRMSEWIQIKYNPETKEKTHFIHDHHRNLIQRMFSLYKLNLSDGAIATKFNKEGILDFAGNAWTNNRVRLVLTSRVVTGRYIPKKGTEIPIKDLRIISDAEWHEVQDIRKKKRATGRKSPDVHIFSGLVTCGYCLAKEKRSKNKILNNSTIIYIPKSEFTNRASVPRELAEPSRRYYCQSGRIDSRNCTCDTINYYHLHDSIFSFLKDLDFSSLLNLESKIDDKFLDTKIAGVRAEIAEMEIKINEQKRLLPFIKNDNEIAKIADEINKIGDDRDIKANELEDLKLEKSNKQNEKKDFLESQKTIKDLFEKSYNDNFWYAIRGKMIELYHEVPEGSLSKAQLKEKKDISRLWDLHLHILDADKAHRDAYTDQAKKATLANKEKLEKEEADLINKYFKAEYEADQKALEFKNALHGQLRRFIKQIKIYPYGFSTTDASVPYEDRKGIPSTYYTHKEMVLEAEEELLIKRIENAEPENKDKGWMKKEIPKVLEIPSTTYRRYIDLGKLKDYSYTKKNLKPLYLEFKKRSMEEKAGTIKRTFKADYAKYFSYSIEFTDLCKPDIIKYIVPFYKDRKQGISYEYNSKTRMLVQDLVFGEVSNWESGKKIDPVFIKANALMDDHVDECSPDHIVGYISSIPRGIQEKVDAQTGVDNSNDDSWMIPHSWKNKELQEIQELCKKHKMWTSKEVLKKVTFHSLILEEKTSLENPRLYKPLWFTC